jgi:hypothetical protein
VYKIFEAEDFNRLTKGMKLAHCMGSSSMEDVLTSKYAKCLTVTGFNITIQSTYCKFHSNKVSVLASLFLSHCK